MNRRDSVWAGLVAGALLLAAPRANAQDSAQVSAQSVGAISGYVVDRVGHAIAGVRVLVLGTPLSALSGKEGEYRLDSVSSGGRFVRFRSPGRTTLTVALQVEPNQIADLDVRLDSAAMAVDTLAPPDAPDFPNRTGLRQHGQGNDFSYFITRATIDDKHATRVTDIVRKAPLINVRNDAIWSQPTISNHAVVTRVEVLSEADLQRMAYSPSARGAALPPRDECKRPWAIMLDGYPLDPRYRVNDVPPDQLAGIELRLPSAHMMESADLQPSPACGIVFLWTR